MEMKVSEIARLVEGRLVGRGDVLIRDVAKIEEAQEGTLTFLANPRYSKFLHITNASAVLVGHDVNKAPLTLIQVDDPSLAFLKILRVFHPPVPSLDKRIHPTVIVGDRSVIGQNPAIGPLCVIGKGFRIGRNVQIHPQVTIGDRVRIGDDVLIHANVSIREGVIIGNRVVIQNGTVIGSDGFGFVPKGSGYEKVPQVGTVVIEDDVEIGAGCTVDRATLGETRIGRGSKLDNLIQVAHNVVIGENTVIAAQAGISGSTKIGKGVMIGGQAGFAGHIEVGDKARVGARAGVTKSVKDGEVVSGYPARPHREELRIEAHIRRIPAVIKRLTEIEKKLNKGKK